MKQLILLFILGITAAAHIQAQTILLADTALVTDVGYGGAPASCKSNDMTYNAVNMDEAQHTWLADDFTIPANTTWAFDTVILYGYQYGTGLSSPFTGCHLLILNGAPGAGGSIVWGDTSTNVLSSTDFTGIYKVDTFAADNGLLSNKRAIMYLKLYLPQVPVLTSGTYWLAWQASCATNVSPAICPYKVLPGRINPPGQNSRVYTNGSWQYVVDSGNAVGLNMIIKGAATVGVKSVYNPAAENILSQNVPNPFSNTTVISYSLPKEDNVKLAVYNILGQCVATLADGTMSKGEHKVTFNTGDLPNGTYYYKLSTTEATISKQMVLVK